MWTILQGLRYGVRVLLKNWSVSAIIIIVLALGIGANTAIFSVVNGTLLVTGRIAGWKNVGTSALPQPLATPTPPALAGSSSSPSPNQEINNGFVKQISKRISGHENEPAEQVFKNIQWLKGVPAGRLLLIMNVGYSRALGVNCTHCHMEQDFSSDDKRPKRAAREMAVMHRMINEQLKKMQSLEPRPGNRAINCSTCHRGAIDPLAAER